MSNIYGYIRVSTKKQLEGNSLEQQLGEITERYFNAKVYEEQFTSKTSERPVFKNLLSILENDDTLVVTKLDRFARSALEGIQTITELMNKGVKIHILNMGLIEDSHMGKLIVTNLLAFAEFERSMIIERTQIGKAIAKTKEGFKDGRPKKYTRKQIDHALSLLSVNGGQYSYTEVSDITNISKSTLIRANRQSISTNERKQL